MFTCEVTQASSIVNWAKGGKGIKKNQKYNISQQDKIMKLTIHNVSVQDTGEYSCEVVAGATTKAILEINGKMKYFVFFYLNLTSYCCLLYLENVKNWFQGRFIFLWINPALSYCS